MTSPDPRRDNHGNSCNSRDPLPTKATSGMGCPRSDRLSRPVVKTDGYVIRGEPHPRSDVNLGDVDRLNRDKVKC